MPMTLSEMDTAIDNLVRQLAQGTQMVRFQDGSMVQYIEAAQARERLRMLREERDRLTQGGAGGAAPARSRVTFFPVGVRRGGCR